MTEAAGHNDLAAVRVQLESTVRTIDELIAFLVDENMKRIEDFKRTYPDAVATLSVYQDERLRNAVASKASALVALAGVVEAMTR